MSIRKKFGYEDDISYLMRRVEGKRNCLSCRRLRSNTCPHMSGVLACFGRVNNPEIVGKRCLYWR